MNKNKILKKLLSGSKNISFDEFVHVIELFGFVETKTNGRHHFYQREDVTDMVKGGSNNYIIVIPANAGIPCSCG